MEIMRQEEERRINWRRDKNKTASITNNSTRKVIDDIDEARIRKEMGLDDDDLDEDPSDEPDEDTEVEAEDVDDLSTPTEMSEEEKEKFKSEREKRR